MGYRAFTGRGEFTCFCGAVVTYEYSEPKQRVIRCDLTCGQCGEHHHVEFRRNTEGDGEARGRARASGEVA